MKPVVLFGNNMITKEILLELKTVETDFKVVAVCISDNYIYGKTSYYGAPIVAESEVVQKYPPSEFDMLSCVETSSRVRNRLLVYEKLKGMGYSLRNYISPFAHVDADVTMGDNNIIMASARIIHDACIGHSNHIDYNVLIAHHVVIGNGTTIKADSVLGGFVTVGDSCWLGLKCVVNSGLTVGNETLIATGAVVLGNTKPCFSYIGNPAKPMFSHEETGIIITFPKIARDQINEMQHQKGRH